MRRFRIRKANRMETKMFILNGRKWLINGKNGFPYNMRKVADMLIKAMEIEKLLYDLRDDVSFVVNDHYVESLVCDMYEKADLLLSVYKNFASESCETIKNANSEHYSFDFETYEHMLKRLDDRAEKIERDL